MSKEIRLVKEAKGNFIADISVSLLDKGSGRTVVGLPSQEDKDALRQEEFHCLEIRHLMEVIFDSDFSGKYPEDDESGELLYAVTNDSNTFGARVLLREDKLKEYEKRYGAYYILPSSVHEILIMPVSEGRVFAHSQLQNIVKEINVTEVRPADRLSNNIFMFKDGKLSCITDSSAAEQ